MDVNADALKPRVAQIARLSPSRASVLLSCPLAEAFRTADSVTRLPTHPKGHFGMLVHSFLAAASAAKEAELRQLWASHVRQYEAGLLADPIESCVLPLAVTCDDFEVNSILAIKTAGRLCRPGTAVNAAAVGTETGITSKDGLIAGRLDKIKWSRGAAVITDVKTGKPIDADGKVREDLSVQLKLYAYLVHDHDGTWPESVRIQPLSGEPIEVKFSSAEAEALAEQVKEKLAETNGKIQKVLEGDLDETALANPSPTGCRFCKYRMTCRSYWEARKLWLWETAPPDIEGLLVSVTEQSGGFFLLGIEAPEGASAIRGFRLQFMRNGGGQIKTGRSTRACELRRERAPRTFSCRPMTVLLQL